jgi:hypothetical protein
MRPGIFFTDLNYARDPDRVFQHAASMVHKIPPLTDNHVSAIHRIVAYFDQGQRDVMLAHVNPMPDLPGLHRTPELCQDSVMVVKLGGLNEEDRWSCESDP